MRLGRLLFRRLRPSAARHGHRPETENPAGSELCAMGPCRKICTETTRHDNYGNGRNERLPRRTAQRRIPQDTLHGIRRARNPLGIRDGGTHLASLLRGREPLPLSSMDAGNGPRHQRPARPAACRHSRRTERNRPGQPLVVRIYRNTRRRTRIPRWLVRGGRPHRPCGNPRLQPVSTINR